MISEYEKQLGKIKENLDKAKNLKIRAEARLEELNRQREELLKELKVLDISPDKLESEIERLKNEIDQQIKQANDIMPEIQTERGY